MSVLSLCLHLSSFTIYLLIATVFVINYGLKCFTILDIAYIHHSAHILFMYKLVLILLNWGFKHSLVFYILIELSVGIKASELLWFHYLSVVLDPC